MRIDSLPSTRTHQPELRKTLAAVSLATWKRERSRPVKITVQYAAQVKAAAGARSECVELNDGATAEQVVLHVAGRGNEALRRLLLAADGSVQPALLLFLGEECVSRTEPVALREGDTLTIMSPISGG
jgi:molybdopterin converting factor small subunit